ncbi:MAG TPA: glycosyltransferase family 2 protein [Candidatus Magasanikbacteria bacterium]|nr:glycosyltransferase family 2 protein [Candidatus Magasanikbacteria bacterium]
MLAHYPKIGIVYLLYYHNESYIDDVVSALKKITYPKDRLELIIVANEHPTNGSFVHYIDATVVPLSGKEFPRVTVLPQKENLGFAGGNNAGSKWAIQNGCEYIFFHNNDGFVASNAFEPLVQALEADKTIGLAQSLVMLHPETNLLNSAGNSFHYLGFGYCDQYRVDIAQLSFPAIKDVDYTSGAALFVRSDLIEKHGGWDSDFFMYHEDLEWSFRLRTLGYRSVLVRDSLFYHKYQFGRSMEKLFFMERNRVAVMIMFFKIPTLLLLLPISLVLEVGLWIFAIKAKNGRKRLEMYRYWTKKKHWSIWLAKRRKIQRERVVGDRELLRHSVPGIYFQDSQMDNPLLVYVGNPIMKLYWWVVVKGLIWW